MKTPTDHSGQPLNFGFNANRRIERDISEMLGLAKGILSDGSIDDAEVKHIQNWMASHPDILDVWPCNIIFQRLERIFVDRVVSTEERPPFFY